jgi:hypothetical protein
MYVCDAMQVSLDHDIRNLPLFCMFFCEWNESVREDLACRDRVHLNEREWKEEEEGKKRKMQVAEALIESVH